MRRILGRILLAMAWLVLALCMTYAILDVQAGQPMHNPYWPFTVETQVRDR